VGILTVRHRRWLLALGLLAAAPAAGLAQLISPGKLSKAHASVEGLTRCTECHELGKRGADDTRCLKCHDLLARRTSAKKGLHRSFQGQTCASCHKEHFGPSFDVVRLDTAAFDHDTTGFTLRQAHARLACRKCHEPALIVAREVREYTARHQSADRTYLGLGTGCLDCHRRDDPHRNQFRGKACTECHDKADWKDTRGFDHSQTRYPLTGEHVTVKCSECHEPERPGDRRSPVRYAGVPFAQCTDCHTDPHKGVMKGTCASCHVTSGWKRLDRRWMEDRFDHGRTRFALNGAHARARCDDCHRPRARGDTAIRLRFVAGSETDAYPRPVVTGCMSCHTDAHRGTFDKTRGGAACDNCHVENDWHPTTYDFARHNRETYLLDGGHITVPCLNCHTRPASGGSPRFRLARECAACHDKSDPHGGQFPGQPCTDCHLTNTFKIAVFDHAKTRYPLDGQHRSVPCASCHRQENTPHGVVVRYRPLGTDCKSCHGGRV
jgi:hypothetical protein